MKRSGINYTLKEGWWREKMERPERRKEGKVEGKEGRKEGQDCGLPQIEHLRGKFTK